jgi:hypothetical protein
MDQSKCFLGPQSYALVGFLDSVATVTAECYCGAAIACGRPCVAKSLGSCTKTFFYDNAWHHTASWASYSLRYSGWVAVGRNLYSLDLVLLPIHISDPSDITWLAASDFQQTPTGRAVIYWLQM